MAAYEVLLLNTAIPQIQAAQSGDTYVVPRDIAINATAIISANSATDALRITQTGAGNAILVEDSANPDSTPFVVTAAGDVGIGTSLPGQKLVISGSGAQRFDIIDTSGATGRISTASGAVFVGTTTNHPLSLFTNDAVKATLDSSGNLGLGVTPSAWGSGYAALQIKQTSLYTTATEVELGSNHFVNSSGQFAYIGNGFATRYEQYLGAHSWHTAPNNTSGAGFAPISFTQAMTLNALGNLALGSTSTPTGQAADNRVIQIYGAGTANRAQIHFCNSDTGETATDGSFIGIDVNKSLFIINREDAPTIFENNGAERARITSGGYFKASDNGTYFGSTGTYHELRNTGNSEILYGTNTNANPFGVTINYTAAAPNGAGNSFLQCVDNAATRAVIRSNGGLANFQANDVNLSDQRVKKDIVAAPSYWDKIKGIEIVHFKYKDQTHDDNNVGVIAQQVEQVAPEFVDQDGWGETPEDGVPLKSIYTSDMYHAAIKALQEAMARIETLEAEVAALKGA